VIARSPQTVRREIRKMDFFARITQIGCTRFELAAKLGIDQKTLRAKLETAPLTENKMGRFPADETQLWIFDHLEEFDTRRIEPDFLVWAIKQAVS